MTEEQKKKFAETKELLSKKIEMQPDETKEQFELRKHAFKEKQINQFKELLLQDVTKNGTNRSFMQYTKAKVKNYLKNPFNYKAELRAVSQFLYRVCTLYKKIILYYSQMPTFNYMVTQKIDATKSYTNSDVIKKYQSVLQRMQNIDISREFSTAMAIAQRDGIYCSYIYNLDNEHTFFNMLDPDYYKILSTNEDGQWVVCFDASYFAKGNNIIYVEGLDGDTSGCWDQVFIDGWNAYNTDRKNCRWFVLPSDRTMVLLANMDDEFDIPLPFWTGIFVSLLDMLDYEQIIADKTALENYVLLVSKIPLLDDSVVDDFAISLEMVQAMQELINAAVPALCGTAYSPMDLEVITFDRSNSTSDTDALSNSINNIFNLAGPPQLVVAGGSASQSTAIKQAIANDSSLAFMWLDRLESNFEYYFNKNISADYIFKVHRQTWYYIDEYISRYKDGSTLGIVTPMEYMTALGNTPYEAWCKLRFDSMLGLRQFMIPLESSYNTALDSSSTGGRPESTTELENPESIATRDSGKNETTKAANG